MEISSFSIVFVCLLSMALPLINTCVPDPMETPINGKLPSIYDGGPSQKSPFLNGYKTLLGDELVPLTGDRR